MEPTKLHSFPKLCHNKLRWDVWEEGVVTWVILSSWSRMENVELRQGGSASAPRRNHFSRCFVANHYQWLTAEACRQAMSAPSLVRDEAITADCGLALLCHHHSAVKVHHSCVGDPSCRANIPSVSSLIGILDCAEARPRRPVHFYVIKRFNSG